MSLFESPAVGLRSSAKPKLIILGAGRPYRGDKPSALIQTSSNKRVLDWTLDAFDRVMQVETHFVGGYRLDEIVRAYPRVYISVNPDWERQGSLGSLLAAPLSPGQTTYVCYADIVTFSETVQLLRDTGGDVVIDAEIKYTDAAAGAGIFDEHESQASSQNG